MRVKHTHIIIILILFLNIIGAGPASASADCVMTCCDSPGVSAEDASSPAARDCCDDPGPVCGPEAAGHPEFEGILPCPIQTHTAHLAAFAVTSPPASSGTIPGLHPSPSIHHFTASTQPLFILNLSWIC